jgi:hypothetical protein
MTLRPELLAIRSMVAPPDGGWACCPAADEGDR